MPTNGSRAYGLPPLSRTRFSRADSRRRADIGRRLDAVKGRVDAAERPSRHGRPGCFQLPTTAGRALKEAERPVGVKNMARVVITRLGRLTKRAVEIGDVLKVAGRVSLPVAGNP